jgi:uncharacterized protein YcfJ
MSQILDALNMAASPNYGIDQILQSTQPTSQPGTFRKILGGVVGGVGNMFLPGLGGLIGSAISGGVGGGLMGQTMQYLQLQQQMNAQSEAFETASAVLKSRHEASMDAIRNIN